MGPPQDSGPQRQIGLGYQGRAKMAPLHARGYFRKAKLGDDWRIIEPADELSPITLPGFAPGPVPPRSIVFSPLCFSR